MWNKKYKGYHFKLICNKLKVVFTHHKFSADLSRYASKCNESEDNWRCTGMLEDREKENDKWITVTGNGKTEKLLYPKSNPKVHNAFAILFQPNAPTYYDTPSPLQKMDDDKTIIPPGPQEHHRQ